MREKPWLKKIARYFQPLTPLKQVVLVGVALVLGAMGVFLYVAGEIQESLSYRKNDSD